MKIVKNSSLVLHVHIYNAQTKGIQQKSMMKPALNVEGYTPGQFIALQAFNGLEEKLSGYVCGIFS